MQEWPARKPLVGTSSHVVKFSVEVILTVDSILAWERVSDTNLKQDFTAEANICMWVSRTRVSFHSCMISLRFGYGEN